MTAKARKKIPEYPVVVTAKTFDGEKLFVAEIPELKGCVASGKTEAEAIKKVRDLSRTWIEVAIETGEAIPAIEEESRYSGRFIVRIPRELHRALHERARSTNISLNSFVKRVFELAISERVMGRDEQFVLLEDIKKTVGEISTLIKTHHCPYMVRLSSMMLNFSHYDRDLSFRILSSRERRVPIQAEDLSDVWSKFDTWENIR